MAEKRKSIEELLKESRKKQNSASESNTSTRKSIDDLILESKAPSALEELEERLKKYAEESYDFSNSYTSRYFDEEGNYLNQYRSDSSDWLKTMQDKNNYFTSEANAIKNILEQYKAYVPEESYKDISDMLETNSKALSDMYAASREDNDLWSQWESEDAYKQALAQLEEYEKFKTYDLEAAKKEIDELKAELETRQKRQPYESEIMDFHKDMQDNPRGALSNPKYSKEQLDSNHFGDDNEKRIAELKKSISEKESYYNRAERIQTAEKLSSVADPNSENYDPEFEKYAQMGEALENPSFEDALYDAKVFGFEIGGEEVLNKVKFAKENIDEYEASATEYGNAEHFGVNPIYSEVNDNEYQTYNYYLSKDIENAKKGEKTNLADEYLKSIEEVLATRRGTRQGEMVNENGAFLQTLFGLATGAANNIESFKNYFSDEDYIPLSAGQVANQVVAQDMADKGWFADKAYQTASVIGNMLPSIAIGTLSGGIGSAVGGTAGAIITTGGQILASGEMGVSAAGNAYQGMLNEGYNKGQARLYGSLVGASEATLQYLLGGISSMGGKLSGGVTAKMLSKIDSALGRFAIKYGGSIGSEILEEELQLFIEPFLKTAIFKMDYDAPNIDEMLDTAIVTFFSTGILEGPGIISSEVDTYKTGKNIKANEGKTETLVELGKNFSEDTTAYRLAKKISEETGKKTGAYTVGRLSNEVQQSMSDQNRSDIQDALIRNGIDEAEAKKISKWMNKVVEGGKLTQRQQAQLESNEELAEVLYGDIMSSDSSVMQRGTLYNQLYGIAESMGVDRAAIEETQTPEAMTQRLTNKKAIADKIRRDADPRSGLSEADMAQINEFAAKSRTAIPEANYQDVGQNVSNEPSSVRIADVADKVSDTNSAINKVTGEDVSIKGIASIDTKSKTMKLELADGTTVNSNDIAYESNEQAVLYESALEMGYTPQVANSIIQGYTPNSNISVENYLIGTNEAFHYGWGHVPSKGRIGSNYKMLTESQRDHAVKVGEEARVADDKARELKASKKKPQVAKSNAKGEYGVRFAVDEKSLTNRAKESVKALEEVAKALKVNIVVDNLNGNAYGYYNPSTNEIIIDANAGGKGKNTLLFTASHELVHYVRNWSPAKFTVLADFLMEQYVAKGENVDALIRAEIDKAYKATRGKVEMTYDEAYEEVVAQGMQSFLTDSNFVERLAELQKKDASLAKRLVSKLKKILDNIRAAYQGLDPTGRASEVVKEMGEAADELYAKMEEALIAASEASQTIGSRNLEEFSEAKNTNGEELFQYKAMEEDEETYRQMLKKHGRMSDSEINKLFSTVDKALAIIKNNLEVLDYAWEADIDDRSFSPVKANSDNLYKVSLDFSTLCRKRILQQVIQTQLQDALNKPLSREESIAIRDELMKIQEEGRQIEIACALCYVESARMKSPAQIKKFLKDRDGIIKEFLASKSGGDIKQKIAKAETDARNKLHKENPNGIIGKGGVMIDPRSANLNQMTKKDADVIRAAKKEAKQSYTPTAEEQKLIDAAKSMSVTDFTSPEGLGNLAKNYPVLFDAYTSFVRNATKSKGIEKDTWWRAGDSDSIGDTLIANMNRENGLRSQSWSDFQVIHMLDYIAATIELSTKNAKEQAYSKVPDYIELMGNTGAMLNMSLIPMAKFNGKLEYDSVEGMAYKKALELREKYHATAGTICIGISNEQIKMLLDDSTIDYVIPYHKSGMAANIRKKMHIPTWTEYEKYQNETNLSRSEAEKQAKKYGVELLSESDENYQKHTAFSEWFDIEEAKQIAEQENAFPSDAKLQKKLGKMYGGYMAMQNAANNYLKLCAERGISPKFSHENANFTEEANYWKLIIDRKMVDNVTGEIIEQQAIKPIFDETEVLRILNDELERYPKVKADQDYATRTVVDKFLSGEMNNRLDADTIAAIMQKPVDNIATTNIVASADDVKAQYAEGEMFEEDKYYARQIDKWEALKDTSYITVGMIKENSPLNRIGMTSGNLYFDVSKIKEAMGDHKDHLSKAILKDIPKLLNNPIAIVEYNVGKNMNTANVYGELYYQGTPITVGIVATLSRGKTVISKVRTVHARRDFATQITDDSILFLGENKKETNRWFQAQGQPVPMRGTKYGFIRSIHDIPQNVKANQENSSSDIKAQYIDTETDRTYLDAVERGDTATQEKMVEEAAKKAGHTERLYHGTVKHGHTKLDVAFSDDKLSYFATSDLKTAKSYAKGRGVRGITESSEKFADDWLSKEAESSEKWVKMEVDDWVSRANEHISQDKSINAEEVLDALYKIATDASEGKISRAKAEDLAEKYAQDLLKNSYDKKLHNGKPFWMWKDSVDYFTLTKNAKFIIEGTMDAVRDRAAVEGAGVYGYYANTDGFLEIEGNGAQWNDIKSDLLPDITSRKYKKYGYKGYRDVWTTRSISKYAKDMGYRGVKFKDIYDVAEFGYVLEKPADVYSFFYPQEQLKSADPVTYDDNGNVIPLSERFNSKNDDIRYQYADREVQPITEAEYKDLENHFGTTGNFKVAGYLLADGKLLDFSGKHWGDTTSRMRQVDHRDVQEVLDRGNNGVNGMVDMIGNGNIRLMPETGGINLATYPNEKQRRVLSQYINYMLNTEGQVIIDYDKVGGDTEYSKVYGKTASSKQILNDIRNYFNGARPSELMSFHSFQYKDMDSIDNRTLLAKSLEGAAKNDIEKTKLKEYQSKIELINAEEKKLRGLREQIKEISFSKGTRDTEKLKKLQFEAKQSANRINVYDKQLLKLEATKPLMDVLQREKDLVRKKMDQERKEAVKAAKEKSMATIREIMDRNTESRKKAIEGRNKTQVRHKIKGVVGELNQLLLKGTKDKHVMIGLQKAVASALDAVNMDTVGADERVAKYDALIAKANDPDVIASLQETRDRIAEQGNKMNEKLTALKNAYKEIKNSKDPLIANSHDEVIESKIESVVNSIGETSLRDMSLEQLEDVYDMYKMVLTTIRNSNKAFKMDKAESISSLGNNVMGEIESVAGSKEYTATALEGIKKFGWNSLKPTHAFEIIGSGTFKNVFANVRAGEDTWAVDVNEAREYYREKTREYNYDSWDFKKQHKFISKTGKQFSLSLEQIMSLYAYSKRKQADLHLDQGGFVFDEAIEVVEKKKGIPVKYKVNTARAYSISKEALTDIVGKLTDEQKAFVDEMQTYLSEVMGEKGNEVSLEMYGVKLFKEKNYFPLKSAKQFMFEQNEVAGEVRIKNSGFSKETVVNANNPIILSNFMDVWAKHVNDMSMYHSFVLPLEDFNRVFNYKTPTGDNLDTESVKMYLQNAYGTQPVQYIKQLLTDLNGGARVEPNADFINKGLSLFKKGAVFASASVVIQQPSAMARAFAYIDPKYFATAKTNLLKHSKDWEECKQYAPVARIKEMGYFDTNVGMQTTEWITAKEYKGFKEKLKGLKDSNYRDEVLSKAPALADELTWAHIWNAVKKETEATTDLEVGSEEFLKKAGERFTEVIVNTQVYDSVLSRSGMMRSKDTGMKMATAFMAEPTTALNMMVNSVVQAKRGNKKFSKKIAGAVASSIILNSILVSLVYAARDDDDDETYAEKYLGSLTSELLDGFNPVTYIPFIKDIWSIAQGYDVERSDMSTYSKLWESFEELFDDKKAVTDKVVDFSGSVATMFGLPLKNITRDAMAVLNLITNDLGIKDTTMAGVGYALSDAARNAVPLLGRFYKEDTKAQKLYDAILSGDTTQIIRMKSQFKDEESYKTAKRTALRENDERIKEAAQERLNGNAEEYKRIAREIVAEGHFTQDDVVAAINAAMRKLNEDVEEDVTDNTEDVTDNTDEDKATSYYKASDINSALENGDATTALKVIDDLVQVKTENYISDGYKKSEAKKKAEASVKSSVTSYWKPLYLEAKENKDLDEVKRIKAASRATKLYDNITETTDDWWTAYKKSK